MKKSLLFFALIFSSLFVYCQSVSVIKNYQKGTKLVKAKKYQEGISYLSSSIDEQPTANAYYNRAAAYFSLGDTCSFCNDLKRGSALGDQAAGKLFQEICTYKIIAKDIPDDLQMRYPSLKRVEATFNLCDNDSTIVFVYDYEGYEYESSEISEIGQSPVFVLVEEMPKFVGGEEARRQFMENNIIYPEQAYLERIEGTVYISFVIDETGSVTEVKALRGLEGGCTEEAIRVVKMMPKWKPGKQKGKPVKVKFNMPVKFNIDGRIEDQSGINYFKAVTNLNAGDTCKSCAYLYEARKYGHNKASELYQQTCFRYDTIREISDSLLAEYPGLSYVLITYSICKSDTSFGYFNEKNEHFLSLVETAPEFPGGDNARMIYLQKNMMYPQEAREKGIQGIVYVTFTVDRDGSITEIRVLRSPGNILSREAIRVVKAMPQWKPATQKGKPVRVQFNMSLKFTLGN